MRHFFRRIIFGAYGQTAKKRRKGGWDIVIKPNDVNDVREFSLMITENGYATLRALSNSRQSITYNGYLAERVR